MKGTLDDGRPQRDEGRRRSVKAAGGRGHGFGFAAGQAPAAVVVGTKRRTSKQEPAGETAKKSVMSDPPEHPKMSKLVKHRGPPKLAHERTGINDVVASFIARTVGSMWMFYGSVIGFAVWMAGLGVTVAGDSYPFNLMLLAVGGIMQWLAMIAILVAQNVQGAVQDKQVEHLHDLGVTTHMLVVENIALTEVIHDHVIKMGAT